MKLDLSPEEEAAAAATVVHVLWVVYAETNSTGGEGMRGIPLSVHASPEEAESAIGRRKAEAPSGEDPSGSYVVEKYCNLLALGTSGFADAEKLRLFLKSRGSLDLPPRIWNAPGLYTQQLSAPPLTAEESRRAQRIQVWILYYEDWFEFGADRDSFPVAVCLSEAEAAAEVARKGAVASGKDGYLAKGPYPLAGPDERSSEIGATVIREVLRRVDAREGGPVPITS
ncbi:MAG TPA: hypothetical protein VKU80_11400 [Planctomycetota bacterium]|nr:hypothetical protein [Planctomycetota bacterium]